MQRAQIEQHLLGDIYDAAINESLWPKVMAGVAGVCGADKVMMSATNILNPSWNLSITHNIDLSAIDQWRTNGYADMEVKIQGAWMDQIGLIKPSCSDDWFGGPEGYQRVAGSYYDMLESENIRRQVLVMFERGSFRFAGLGLNNWDPFPEYSSPTLERLSPHLRRALEIHRQLAAKKVENKGLYQVLDGLVTGVLLLDTSCKIRYANTSAAQQLRQHGGIHITKGQIIPEDTLLAKRLQVLLEGAIRTSQRDGDGRGSSGVVGLPSSLAGNALTLTVVPLSYLAGRQELDSDRIAAAIFISEANGHHQISSQALKEHFRLTAREVQICQGFINNPSLEELAHHLGLTVNSLRTMIKSVYQKTGRSTQAKLMHLLMEIKEDFRHK